VTSPTVETPPSDLSDALLIERCLQDDSFAWEALIRRYQSLIYSVPIRYRFSLPDAADVFQSVCVILMEKLKTLRHTETLSSWLFITTRRECWKFQKKRSREVELETNPMEAEDTAADEVVLQHEVRQGLEKLSEKCRELLNALYFEDPPWSYEQITERMRIPFGSIGPSRARCLERLKRNLTQGR